MRCLLNLLLVLGIAGLLAADGTSLWAQPLGKGSTEGPKTATAPIRLRGGIFRKILRIRRSKAAKSPPRREAGPKPQPLSSPKPRADSTRDPRPTRHSRVTRDLPEQYREQDTDRDGQIGFYEWPRGKFAEFFKLDRNSDGFLTPRELIRADGAESHLAKNAE